jgi:hypothetical protein
MSANLLRFAATLFSAQPEVAAEFMAFAAELDGAGMPPPPAARNMSLSDTSFGYYRSDYAVHRRNGWSASWKGRSNRTIPARCVNDDSKMSADTGEGSTFVYRSDEDGSAYAGIWPVINWQQFPGVTVVQGTLQPCNWTYTYSEYPTFVGTASNDGYTMAAQTIASHGLTARRSWLFLDDAVASMVSNLKIDAQRPSSNNGGVQTTLANQRLACNVTVTFTNGTTRQLLSEGNHTFAASTLRSVWHNHTTYIFTATKAAATVEIENGQRTGDYYRISTMHKPASGRIFRISYRHALHNDRRDDTAAGVLGYAVVPNSERQTGGSTAATTVLDGNTHAIADLSAGIAAVTWWKAGSVKVEAFTFRASSPCLMLIRGRLLVAPPSQSQESMQPTLFQQQHKHKHKHKHKQQRQLTIAVSNPDQPRGLLLTMSVEYSMPAKSVSGAGCALSRPGTEAEVKVTLPGGEHMGQTVVCILGF